MSVTEKEIEETDLIKGPVFYLKLSSAQHAFSITWIQFGQPAAPVQLQVETSSKAASRSSPKSIWAYIIRQNTKRNANFSHR